MPTMTEADVSRFWGKVDRGGDDDACWPWTGARSNDGYGRFKVAGSLYSPHRVAHHLANEPIPDRLKYIGLVLHSCDNPRCCNPKHLRLGTGGENNAQAVASGRWGPVTANLPWNRARFGEPERRPVEGS